MHYVRISGHPLKLDKIDQIIEDVESTHVFGIETDNDIEGRYESFLAPTEKLKAIKAVAERARAIGNYAFVYVAGFECITANAAKVKHSLYKDHPEWLQRNIKGEPALFGRGVEFWVEHGDEDVWVTPCVPEWRKVYMEHVRQIAATGIDGINVDVPYWMTPRTLKDFHGRALALPGALPERCGACGAGVVCEVRREFDRHRKVRAMRRNRRGARANLLHWMMGIGNAAQKSESGAGHGYDYLPPCPGRAYGQALEAGFRVAVPGVSS